MRQRRAPIVKLSLVFLGVLCLASGCAGDGKKTPTPKQEAIKQWNDARSTVMLNLARDQYEALNFDKSRQTVNEALRLSPDSSPGHVLSAKLYIEAGQLEAAERELAAARQCDPVNAEAEYLSGVVFQRWQQPERALEFYQHACDKAPAELSYLMAKAEMLVEMDRQTEALAMLQAKVTYFEHSAAIRDEVGLLLMEQTRYPEAVEMLRRATILATDDLTIREHLALALYSTKNYPECAETLGRLLKDEHYQQRADLLLMLGQCQLQTGQAGEARENLQAAAEIMPTLAGVWVPLARASLQINDLRRADIALHQGLTLAPYNGEGYLLLGYLRLKQSRFSEALQAFENSSRLMPDDTTSLCMVGYTLDKLGQAARARQFYSRALKLNPNDEMAAQLMARVDLHE